MKSIYEISKDYIEVLSELENNGGEFTEDIETALAIPEAQVKQKSIAYVAVVKSIEAETNEIKAEISRLTALKKHNDTIVMNMKTRLKNALELFDIPEIKTATNKISFRKSESVIIDDIDLIPETCKKVSVTVTADKKLLKEMLESGDIIIGAHIQENRNLQIK